MDGSEVKVWNTNWSLLQYIQFNVTAALTYLNQGWHEKIIDLNQDFLDFLDLLVLTRYLCVRSLAVSSEEKIQKIQKIIDFYLKKSLIFTSKNH